MTNTKEEEKKDIKDIKEEKTICPFCLIELEDKIDWQKFFLIISGYDDIQLNELSLLNDKANEILRKEVERRTGIKNYETQPQQSPAPVIQGQFQQGQVFPPNAKQMIGEIILKKWKNKLCPFCKMQNWIVSEQIFQLSQWQPPGTPLIIGGNTRVQPVVSVICQNCGYTTLSNAVINGLMKPTQPPPPRPY